MFDSKKGNFWTDFWLIAYVRTGELLPVTTFKGGLES